MKLTKKYLKENIFYRFCEVEYYKINKGFVKATLDELSVLYSDAYKDGYLEAIKDIQDTTEKFYWEIRK